MRDNCLSRPPNIICVKVPFLITVLTGVFEIYIEDVVEYAHADFY